MYIGLPWIYARWLRLSLKLRAAKLRSLVLTFDDGPGSKVTPIILRILKEHHVNATFFLLGRNIQGNESMVRQIATEGHEICSHGYDHLNYWKVSPFRALADIQKGWRVIDDALGTNSGLYPFRPAYGKLNLICLVYLWMCRVPIVYWTFDLGDTRSHVKVDNERIAAMFKETCGAVVLAHDFDRTNESVRKMVLGSVESLLTQAKEKGMLVLTVSQLLKGPKA